MHSMRTSFSMCLKLVPLNSIQSISLASSGRFRKFECSAGLLFALAMIKTIAAVLKANIQEVMAQNEFAAL